MLLVQPNNKLLRAGLAARASPALLRLKGHQQCLSALRGLLCQVYEHTKMTIFIFPWLLKKQ